MIARDQNASCLKQQDPLDVIACYYPPGAALTELLLLHGRQVRDKALAVAERVAHLRPDTTFLAQAALLHDIGIFKTRAPAIHCQGRLPYIRHGVIGRELLEAHGLVRHALVCERHVGVGLSKDDIRRQGLDLPMRDMLPSTLEERIICYADKFFSKRGGGRELPLDAVLEEIGHYGRDKLERFLSWHELFTG